jgi:hypothetical protein
MLAVTPRNSLSGGEKSHPVTAPSFLLHPAGWGFNLGVSVLREDEKVPCTAGLR